MGRYGVMGDNGVVVVIINAYMVINRITSSIYNITIIKMSII